MIGSITRAIARGVLQGLQLASVVAANTPRSSGREYARFRTWDLLKTQRMAERIHDGERLLDVGSGSGRRLIELGMFRRIDRHGVDVHISGAPAGVEMHTYDGKTLPFPDASFDVVTICYVLHHLTPEHATSLMSEIIRVARRKVLVLEDSMPEWTFSYRLRNRFHRIEADLQYGNESTTYTSPHGEAMFLTHDEWKRWFGELPRVRHVDIEALDAISKYAHHTLFDLDLVPIEAHAT
jgi:SAM-dependent methyltransferase